MLTRVADEKVTVSDIYQFVMDGTWMLWVCQIPDTKEITSVLVTEFIHYPQVCNLRVVFLSGDDEDWAYGIKVFEDFARINDCSEVEILGRKGWERVLRDQGFKLNHITLSKRIL
jgi:hypothetical protein|tara:strand:- start:16029 stop:16373 length:345 start_codon:yes stop_codon:yes gene_type:complete